MIIAGLDVAEREVWKVIPEYPHYAASSLGNIKRIAKGKSNATKVGKVLRPGRGGSAVHYLRVCVYRDEVRHYESVHRLVLMAFVGPPPTGKHHGAHNDGDHRNNRPENLRWALPIENSADITKHGRRRTGAEHTNSKITAEQVAAIRALHDAGAPTAKLAAAVGLGRTTVRRIVRRETYR